MTSYQAVLVISGASTPGLGMQELNQKLSAGWETCDTTTTKNSHLVILCKEDSIFGDPEDKKKETLNEPTNSV